MDTGKVWTQAGRENEAEAPTGAPCELPSTDMFLRLLGSGYASRGPSLRHSHQAVESMARKLRELQRDQCYNNRPEYGRMATNRNQGAAVTSS